MGLASAWKNAVVASSGTISAEVDLGGIYAFLEVIIPTIDSSTVAAHISDAPGGTFVPQNTLADAGGHSTQATTAGTGGIAVLFEIGGAQHIKIVCGSTQTAERTFKVRGIGRQ